ncbi:MAG: hypothetical protein WC346_18565 [Methanogenium sp.]
MEEKKVKFFRGKVKSIDPETKTIKAVISDESKDRYKERILVTAFEKTKDDFMKHPVLLSSHSYHGLKNQIGEFKDISIDKKNKEVVGEIEYYAGLGNEEADWAWVLAQKGVAAFSVGFIPKTIKSYDEEARDKNGGIRCDYEDIELLETSQVLIPANPSALQKSFEEETDPEAKDYMEEIMKLSVELGEKKDSDSLPEEIPTEDVETKVWEDKPNEIWHSLKDSSGYSKTRRFAVKKAKPRVFALYGKLSDSDKWEIYALRFPKADGWTMDKAKKWMKSHSNIGKDFFDEEIISDLLNEREYLFESEVLSILNDFVDSVILILGEKKEELKSLEKKEGVEDGEEKETKEESEESDTEHRSEEKEEVKEEQVAELRAVLFGKEISEEDELRKIFDNMMKETKERFAVQS